jgi:hypothetical protein
MMRWRLGGAAERGVGVDAVAWGAYVFLGFSKLYIQLRKVEDRDDRIGTVQGSVATDVEKRSKR